MAASSDSPTWQSAALRWRTYARHLENELTCLLTTDYNVAHAEEEIARLREDARQEWMKLRDEIGNHSALGRKVGH